MGGPLVSEGKIPYPGMAQKEEDSHPERKRRRGNLIMTNQPPLLDINHMSIAFGGLKAIDDVSIQIHKGEFVGLIDYRKCTAYGRIDPV